MMKTLLTLSACGFLLLATTGCQQLRARDNLNKGVRAYKGAKYPEAVNHFLKLPIADEHKRKILWDNCAAYYAM